MHFGFKTVKLRKFCRFFLVYNDQKIKLTTIYVFTKSDY